MSGLEPEEGLADLARESAQHAEEAAKEAQAAAESADEVARAIGQEGDGNSDPAMPTDHDAGGGPGWGGDDGGAGDSDPSAGTDFSGGGYGGGPQGP